MPVGFAHEFLVTGDSAKFLYKTTDCYAPQHDHCTAWNDPSIGIQWPADSVPHFFFKNMLPGSLANVEVFT